MQREDFLPFHRPSIEESDIAAVVEALRSGWLTHGPLCREFEKAIAATVGAARGVSVSSATAAMHLALVAMNIGEGHEVITTPFTFCSTAHVIEHVGATPVFADIEAETLQIDPAAVEQNVTPATKAIMPVHYGGHPCDIERIGKIAEAPRIAVIEDAAHAFGALVGDHAVGSISPATCFSFYATKNITTGEGGMVTTDDDSLADRIESLRLHGIDRDAWNRNGPGGSWYYEVLEPGFKANLTDFQAALGLSQLRRHTELLRRRTGIAERYSATFADVDSLRIPTVRPGVTSAWHLYPLRLRLDALKIDRDEFIAKLEDAGIGASVHFVPLHLQPHFRSRFGFARGDFPNSEAAYDSVVSLPIFPAMSSEDVQRVVQAVTHVARAHGG